MDKVQTNHRYWDSCNWLRLHILNCTHIHNYSEDSKNIATWVCRVWQDIMPLIQEPSSILPWIRGETSSQALRISVALFSRVLRIAETWMNEILHGQLNCRRLSYGTLSLFYYSKNFHDYFSKTSRTKEVKEYQVHIKSKEEWHEWNNYLDATKITVSCFPP